MFEYDNGVKSQKGVEVKMAESKWSGTLMSVLIVSTKLSIFAINKENQYEISL